MSDYNWTERLLHRIALSSTALCEAQFDIECTIEKPQAKAAGEHVFVAGLARAGTTILLRSIHASGAFGTLTYRDMPFVMAPNLWAKVHRRSRRDTVAGERAHGDGIHVDVDSPEALEEVFWRAFEAPSYLTKAGLTRHIAAPETIEAFRKYIALILKRHGATRYLSKNNNNILRIDSLLQACPESVVLVPFRHPVAHAQSLLRQHQRFSQNPDPFTRQYMSWLAHHEFGPGHRPFLFGQTMKTGGTATDLRYWMTLWGEVYASLYDRFHTSDRVRFVCYEAMCSDWDAWPRLAAHLGLSKGAASRYRPERAEAQDKAPPELESLYTKMAATAL